jgi:hypothetical protein
MDRIRNNEIRIESGDETVIDKSGKERTEMEWTCNANGREIDDKKRI